MSPEPSQYEPAADPVVFTDSAARKVDSLIRDSSISAQVATSLMNDSMYANQIMVHLVSMAEGLIASSETLDMEAPDLSLTAEELEQVVDQAQAAEQQDSKGAEAR